jgi:D-alanine-D-alanine ligase
MNCFSNLNDCPELPPGAVVAVLLGGPGSEREVSLRTGASVAAALRARGCAVTGVDARDASFTLPPATALAFIAIHGAFGEDGELQAELERRGIPYTGAGVAASRLAFDKAAAKRAFTAAGVPTPAADILAPGASPSRPLPLVVKPAREGSSVGVHIVREPAALAPALADAFRFGAEVLAEDFIAGRELTVGILGDAALPVVEIRPRSGFYDLANKYPWMNPGGGSDYDCPAGLPPAATAAVQAAALAAHRALGIEVYSRVDVLLDAAGRPWVLEANTIPGMTESSLLPKAAAAAGLAFPDLCLAIARRSLAEARGRPAPPSR